MAEPPRTGKSLETDDESIGGISRWVRVIGITLVVLVLLVVVMLLAGGGLGGHQIPQHAPSLGDVWVVGAFVRNLQ